MGAVSTLTKEEIVQGLRKLGLKASDVVLVHSAMRTLGRVDGGAPAVVSAFLDVIGKSGTLVAPTFTLRHGMVELPLVDPAADPSEMGAISEAARNWPGARHSIACRHRFSAIGRRADVITEVDPLLSPFDLRSSFGVMLAQNTQVVLLGLTYASSTSHHFAEAVCEVPYRHFVPKPVRLRMPDGSIVEQVLIDYQPKVPFRRMDFNRLGRMLEESGRATALPIGNAAVRRFAMRDLIDLAQVEIEKDDEVFLMREGQTEPTPLTLGTIVLSPEITSGAGRVQRYYWCVMDPAKLKLPESDS